MAEKVPLLHIVGYPSRPLSTMFAAKHIYFHHTTEVDPRGSHASVHQPATCSQALLTAVAEEEWTEAFDNVLRDVLANCQPGYVQIPMDAWAVKVSKKGLDRKLVSGRSQLVLLVPSQSSRHLRTYRRSWTR